MLVMKRFGAAFIDFYAYCALGSAAVYIATLGAMEVNIGSVIIYISTFFVGWLFRDCIFNKRSLGKMLFKLTISSDRYTSIVVISLLRNITFLILPIEVFRLLLNKKRIGDIIAHSDIGQGTV